MGKIDDLILAKDVISSNEELKKKIKKYNEITDRKDSLQEKLSELNDRIDMFEYSEGTESDLYQEVSETEESIEELDEELKKIGDVEVLQSKYEQQENKVLETTGASSTSEFYELEEKFLENLIFNEDIANVGESPEEYFKKLIQLYGEEELAHYSRYAPVYKENDPDNIYENYYDEYEESYEDNLEESYEEDFDGLEIHEKLANDDSTVYFAYPHTLHDFIQGKEDQLVGIASTQSLKTALLASKLRTIDEVDMDVSAAINEYSEETYKYGKNYCYNDEYGIPDTRGTLLNLAVLPILEDRNFYMYLVKHIDETQLPIKNLVAYIDPEFINEQFINDLKKARETKTYEYQNEETNNRRDESIDGELIAWLEGKEKTLTSLEKEEKKISEEEQLIDMQKDGQNKGE